jgi:NhaP-type Na+/H+ or K+/H+ antiporter
LIDVIEDFLNLFLIPGLFDGGIGFEFAAIDKEGVPFD